MSAQKQEPAPQPPPELIREPLRFFADALGEALGSNLQSITVVGSSLTADYRPGQSDINTVVLLAEHNLAALNAIASLAKPMRRRRLSAPLLMTDAYIERSRDVFGVELLDFQLTHLTIRGKDPFLSLSFAKEDVRLQCERELKAALIRLRQGYIASAGNRKLIRDVLIATAKSVLPILRAMLWLGDRRRPQCAGPTIEATAKEFSVDLKVIGTLHKWRRDKVRPSEAETAIRFEKTYAAVDRLAGVVDGLEVT